MQRHQISLPDTYTERPPCDISTFDRMVHRFEGSNRVIPDNQRKMYEAMLTEFRNMISGYRGFPKQIHKPLVADVGCGIGIGTNILSQEAQFVWGIDIDQTAIDFATQMFERDIDNVYYTPQVTFDAIDVLAEPRQVMQFDFVVCFEVIEHIPRDKTDHLIAFLNRLCKPDVGETATKIYISTPNRNSPDIQDDTPRNEHHCFEANAGEMYGYLTQKYQSVTVLNTDRVPQELDTKDTPLIFRCETPLC